MELTAEENALIESLMELRRVAPGEPERTMGPEVLRLTAGRRAVWEEEHNALMTALGRKLARHAMADRSNAEMPVGW